MNGEVTVAVARQGVGRWLVYVAEGPGYSIDDLTKSVNSYVLVVGEAWAEVATLVVVRTVVVMVVVKQGGCVVGREARRDGGVVVVVLVTVTRSVLVRLPPEVAWSFWRESRTSWGLVLFLG